MDLLNLKQNQIIVIDKKKYKILNQVKFIEKSSYWIEYKLQNIQNNELYYLNVELSSKAILYKILKNNQIQLKINIIYENEEYELFEKGTGKVETYFGMTDVGLNEEVSYYEYKSKVDNKKILSVEKWKDEVEVSLGREVNLNNIKILNKFEI